MSHSESSNLPQHENCAQSFSIHLNLRTAIRAHWGAQQTFSINFGKFLILLLSRRVCSSLLKVWSCRRRRCRWKEKEVKRAMRAQREPLCGRKSILGMNESRTRAIARRGSQLRCFPALAEGQYAN